MKKLLNRWFNRKHWSLASHDDAYIRSYTKLKRDFHFNLNQRLTKLDMANFEKQLPVEQRLAAVIENLVNQANLAFEQSVEDIASAPKR